MITYIIELIIAFFVTIKFGIANIFFNCITLDSIFTSINFIKIYMQKDLSLEQKLALLQNKLTLLERYIYYGLAFILHQIMTIIFWYHGNYLIYSIFIMAMCPSMMMAIINYHYINLIVQNIYQEICRLTVYIMSKTIAYTLNQLSIMSLNSDPKIDHHEIEAFFENYDNTMTEMANLLKSFLLVFVLYYVRKSNNWLYGYILDTVYYFNSIRLTADDSTVEDKRHQLALILGDRRWDLLIKPKTINMFFEICDDKSDTTLVDRINHFKMTQYFNILKMSAIWAISVIDYRFAMGLIFYFTIEKTVNEFVTRTIAVTTLYFGYVLIACVVAEFGYLLIKLTKELYQYLKRKNLKIFYNHNKYNIFLINTMVMTLYTKDLPFLIISNGLIQELDNKTAIMTVGYYFTATLSSFDAQHLLFLTIAKYLAINIINYCQNAELQKQELDMNYMSGYLTRYQMASSVLIKKEKITINIKDHYF